MSVLPAGWVEAKLPDLVQGDGTFVDGDWVESKDQDPNGDVRLIQLADVGDGRYTNKSARFLTSTKAAELRCTYLRPGDVLVARMPHPLGRACIFPGDPRPSVTVVDVCIIRTGTNGADHRWLMWAINSPQFRRKVDGLQSGSTRKRISRGNLGTLTLPVPPVAEQRRIVAALEEHLSDLDAAMAGLERARANLDHFKAAVLEQLFANTDPAMLVPLSGAAETTMVGLDRGRDKQNREGRGVPYVKMNNVTSDGRVTFDDLAYVCVSPSEGTRFALADGDVLFNTRNSLDLVGKTGLVRHPPAGAVYNNNLMRIRTKPSLLPAYLAWQMVAPPFRRKLDQVKRATTNVAAIYAKDLLPLDVCVPPLERQREVAEQIERQFAGVARTTSEIDVQLQRAARLRQVLLRRAFEGRLVPQDPNDEPARSLLGRIRGESAGGDEALTRTRRRRTHATATTGRS